MRFEAVLYRDSFLIHVMAHTVAIFSSLGLCHENAYFGDVRALFTEPSLVEVREGARARHGAPQRLRTEGPC